MNGVVAPTDTRWRGDIQYYEQGDTETADSVKWEIEEEQRRKRALLEKGETTWEPQFFEKVPHPHLKEGHGLDINEEVPI